MQVSGTPANAPAPSSGTDERGVSPKSTDDSARHMLNAPVPMAVAAGRETEISAEQLRNAPVKSVETAGSETEDSAVQPANVKLSMN